jgi:hypothetical protein
VSTPAIRLALAIAATAIGTSGITACSSPTHTAATPASIPVSHPVAAPERTTLEFVAHDESGNMTLDDLGAKSSPGGPDIGDLLAFTQTLTRDGKPAGQVHVAAVGVDHKRHLSEATGTITLRSGTIQVAGIVTMNPTFTLTVTGGTGTYAGDTGTLEFDASGDVQKLTVHLTGKPAAK